MVIMNFITIVLLHFHIFSLLNVLTPNVTKQMFFKCIYKYNVKYNKLYNLYHDQIYSLLYTAKLLTEFSVFTPKPGHYFESPAPSFYFLHYTNHLFHGHVFWLVKHVKLEISSSWSLFIVSVIGSYSCYEQWLQTLFLFCSKGWFQFADASCRQFQSVCLILL